MIDGLIFNFIQPLDLGGIVFDTMAGSVQVGVYLIFITIMILALFFRMPDIIGVSMFFLFLTFAMGTQIASFTSQFLFLGIVIGVLLFGLIMARIVK